MDWLWITQQIVDLAKGITTFLVGTWLFFKYMLPKLSRDTAIETADALLKHPKVQPLIKKVEGYEKELEPFLDKVKQLDLQELVEMAKSIKILIQTNQQSEPPPPETEQ